MLLSNIIYNLIAESLYTRPNVRSEDGKRVRLGVEDIL